MIAQQTIQRKILTEYTQKDKKNNSIFSKWKSGYIKILNFY